MPFSSIHSISAAGWKSGFGPTTSPSSTRRMVSASHAASSSLASRSGTIGARCACTSSAMRDAGFPLIPDRSAWPRLARLQIGVHLAIPELRRRFGTPSVRQAFPIAALPALGDLVHVGVILDPAAPRIAGVMEQVGRDRVAARTETFLISGRAHPPGAVAEIVEAGDLEARMLEAAVAAVDQAEAMVIGDPVAGRHERDLAFG